MKWPMLWFVWSRTFWFQKGESAAQLIPVYKYLAAKWLKAEGDGRVVLVSQSSCRAHAAGEVPSAQSPVWFRAPLSPMRGTSPGVEKDWAAQKLLVPAPFAYISHLFLEEEEGLSTAGSSAILSLLKWCCKDAARWVIVYDCCVWVIHSFGKGEDLQTKYSSFSPCFETTLSRFKKKQTTLKIPGNIAPSRVLILPYKVSSVTQALHVSFSESWFYINMGRFPLLIELLICYLYCEGQGLQMKRLSLSFNYNSSSELI